MKDFIQHGEPRGATGRSGIESPKTEKKAVRVLVESTPGVRVVNDNLIIPSTMSGWY
jgi:hypothetical protein